jgi:sugar diacid utilization regulator
MPDGLNDLIQRAQRTRRTRARRIIDHCLERLPHYRTLPEVMLVEIRESVLHHLTLFYEVTLQAGRPLTDEDLDFSRRVARLRASQGMPLGEFLTFFVVGLTQAWEHLLADVGDDPVLRTRLMDRVGIVIANQTQLMTALTEVYVETRERRTRFREENLDEFFQLLLAGDAVEEVLEARARTLGISFHAPRTIGVFGASTSTLGGAPDVETAEVERELAGWLGSDLCVGRSRDGFVALLSADPDPDALAAATADLFGDTARVGLGRPGQGIAGARRSALEAVRALRIGAALRKARVVCRYDDLAVLDLVGVGSAGADAFMRSVLGPLSGAGDDGSYLETVRQLARHGYSQKLAASALSLHPHTLTYRVKQIQRRFGLDLADPEVRLRVQLALLILDA